MSKPLGPGQIFFCFFLLLSFLGGELPGTGLLAQAETNRTSPDANQPSWLTPPSFSYSAKDKVDPFASFLRSQAEKKKEERDKERSLSPLQQVEASQLKLVGTMLPHKGESMLMALVELPNGKGYVLRPGTLIGQNQGTVTLITEGQVTIEERRTTPLGQDVLHTVVLELSDSSGERDEP
ncbi:MAG: pilus assembly protein PilP [Desulfovermiculus sp.]